uniref:hypothetical protein n=1 Tax=Vibrio cholerae TaxID=666 RepID=UPI003F5867C0
MLLLDIGFGKNGKFGKPEVTVASNMHACSRGGERNKEESESVKASSLGFKACWFLRR